MWDCTSGLAVVFGYDKCQRIKCFILDIRKSVEFNLLNGDGVTAALYHDYLIYSTKRHSFAIIRCHYYLFVTVSPLISLWTWIYIWQKSMMSFLKSWTLVNSDDRNEPISTKLYGFRTRKIHNDKRKQRTFASSQYSFGHERLWNKIT